MSSPLCNVEVQIFMSGIVDDNFTFGALVLDVRQQCGGAICYFAAGFDCEFVPELVHFWRCRARECGDAGRRLVHHKIGITDFKFEARDLTVITVLYEPLRPEIHR